MPRVPLRLPAVLLVLLAGTAPAAASHALRADGIGDPVNDAPKSACFGAAARDPEKPCRDPKLRLKVVPTPDEAILEPNGRCTPVEQTKVLLPCAFGAPKESAEDTIALLGDSHASHWRAALDVAAVARNWRGISITRSGCPFSRATTKLDDPTDMKRCKEWNKAALAWFDKHPEVSTVFVSQHNGRVVVPAGQTTEGTRDRGYLDVWKALPKTVTRIFVIRDVPRNSGQTTACIERARAAKRPAGPACAVPVSYAVRRDPAFSVAQRVKPARVKTIDLTSFMCSSRLCLPVIGGALVHKDLDHITQTWSTSLGPYLLRAINRIGVPGPADR